MDNYASQAIHLMEGKNSKKQKNQPPPPAPVSNKINNFQTNFKKIFEQQQMIEQNVDERYEYKFGDFSKFAVQKQKQVNQLRKLIDKTIRQAIRSHLQQLEQMMKSQNQLQIKSEAIQRKLKQKFKKRPEYIYKFLQDPIQTFMQMQPFNNIKTYIEQFTDLLLQTYKLSIIDGKLANINQIKMDQALKQQQNLYLPTTFDDKTYVKVGQKYQPSYIYFSEGKLKTRTQLSTFNPQQKQIIINMVRSFLQTKGIVVSNIQLQQTIRNLVKAKIQVKQKKN